MGKFTSCRKRRKGSSSSILGRWLASGGGGGCGFRSTASGGVWRGSRGDAGKTPYLPKANHNPGATGNTFLRHPQASPGNPHHHYYCFSYSIMM